MSEARREAREFVAARREEAIEKACAYFGLEETALSIYGFRPGTVYGLAARTVIVAVPRDRAKPPAQRSRGDGARRDDETRARPGRESGRGREREARGNRDERGSRADREQRDARGNREERDARADREEREPRGERGNREERGSRGERGDRELRAAGERAPQRRDEGSSREMSSVGTAVGELGELGRFLLGAVERMDLGSFEIEENREGDLVVLHVRGSAAEALSAGQGRTVDALQLLVNQVAARGDSERQRVVIDVEGDADAREEFLTKLADRVAKRALQTGRPIALDPMNGRDRRMIHMALRDRDDVATMSEGEGRYRQVVVVPESSDEFEYARTQAERHRNG
ncbi:MAG TPA: R3H domain-containing nucleic acid-binding protein [Myxococcota bacterium]|nr:R3H domain-containing nucleic acid-binding protein [Myxococcota bacterium]